MADDAGYVLSEFDAAWVVSRAGSIEKDIPNIAQKFSPQLVVAQTPGGGIAARSGSTLGFASCTVYKASGGTLTSLSRSITVYNMSTTAVGNSVYIIAALVGNVWIAVWEDC